MAKKRDKNIGVTINEDDDKLVVEIVELDEHYEPLAVEKEPSKTKGVIEGTLGGVGWFILPWLLLYWIGSWLHAIDKH